MASEDGNQPGAADGASASPPQSEPAEPGNSRKPLAVDTGFSDGKQVEGRDEAPPLPVQRGTANGSERPLFDSDDSDTDEPAIPARGETVVSPVTSPPYWAPSPSRSRPSTGRPGVHTNASSESVAAITMWDNEAADGLDDAAAAGAEEGGRHGSGAINVEGRDKNRACWARQVDVVSYRVVQGSGPTNIGAFVVYNIVVTTLNGSKMNIIKRFSEFDKLRENLIFTFPNFQAAVPALPPKTLITRYGERFLENRKAGLQYFLNCILLNPEFSGSPILREFLFS